MPMHIKIDVNKQGRVFAKTRYSSSDAGEYKEDPVVWGASPKEVLMKLAKWVAEQPKKKVEGVNVTNDK